MSGKIIYEDVAPGASDAAVCNGTNVNATLSRPDLLPVGVDNPNLAVLEKNRWLLNGTRKLYTNQVFGLVSSAVSGNDGAFNAAPSLRITFNQQFSCAGLTFRFGKEEFDYPSHIGVYWYRAGAVISQMEFYPNANDYFCDNGVEFFDEIRVDFYKTSLPCRRVRMEHIKFGLWRDFGPADLTKAELVQEANLISAELAINTLDWSFRDVKGTDYMFQFKQPIDVYNGDALLGVFYVNSAKRVGDGSYDVSCVDAIGLLDNEPFAGGVYNERQAASLMQEIAGNLFDFEFDSDFLYVGNTVTGAIKPCTKREALQQVAFAIGAVIDTSGSASILVKSADYEANKISENQLYSGGVVDVESIVTRVIVTWHSYTENANGNVEIKGKKYTETTGTVEVANPNVTANTRANVIEVDGATLVNQNNAEEVANRVYNYYAQRDLASVKIVVNDERPADMVEFTTAWGDEFVGHIEKMNVKLSNTVAAETVARGTARRGEA
jgi:hypothetical protein